MKSGIVGPNYRGSYAFPQKFCSFGSGLAKLLLVKEHLFPPYKMFKKIIKYTFRVVLCGLVLLIVLPFLLYIPGIQNFIRRQAESYVARNTEMRLSVRQIRLSFPLRLVVDDVMVSTPVLDTMAYCTRLEADVALWPLLRGEVVVHRFGFDGTTVNYADSLAQFGLYARVGHFSLAADRIDLKGSVADISGIELEKGTVRLSIGEGPPDTSATAEGKPVAWKIRVSKLALDDIAFSMETKPRITELDVLLKQGNLADCLVDLSRQQVAVTEIVLDGGSYSFLTDTTKIAAVQDTVRTAATDSVAEPWTIAVDRLRLSDNAVTYGALQGAPKEGLDFDHLVLTQLNLSADSIYNRGAAVRIGIGRFSAVERSGLQVADLSGAFSMDSTQVALSDFSLTTGQSSLHVDLRADASALALAPDASVNLRLEAKVALRELQAVLPVADKNIRQMLSTRSLELSGDFAGTLGRLRADSRIAVPGNVLLTLNADVASATDPSRIEGLCRFKGSFSRLEFLTDLLPDTALRRRLRIPEQMALEGSLRMRQGTFYPVAAFAVGSGTATVKGEFNGKKQLYNAELICDSFPVDRFLPNDSLGVLTMRVAADGSGFDPLHTSTVAEAAVRIDRFIYRSYDYGGIALDASLRDHRLIGRLTGESEALKFGLDIEGLLTQTQQAVTVRGTVDTCNLYRMNLSPEKTAISVALDLAVSSDSARTRRVEATADQIVLWDKWRENRIRKTSVSAEIAAEKVAAAVQSGDFRLDFAAPVPVDSLAEQAGRAVALISEQLRLGSLDMELVARQLPPFRLTGSAGANNVVNGFLKMRGMSFSGMSLNVASGDSTPFTTRLRVDRFASGDLLLDTLTFGVMQRGRQLNYLLRMANNPGRMDDAAMIAVYGNILDNVALVKFLQKNREGKSGFDFGLKASLEDSTIAVRMLENPVLGFNRWQVNPDNYIAYRLNRELFADFSLTRDGQQFAVRSDAGAEPGAVTLHVAGIDIASTLKLFLGAPPFSGTFGADLSLRVGGGAVGANGSVSLAELGYENQRIGNAELAFRYGQGEQRQQQLSAKLSLDGAEALSVDGVYRGGDTENPLGLTVSIPGLPLAPANAFLPPDAVRLSGALQGKLTLAGTSAKPKIDGALHFAGTQVQVPMIGTTFGLGTEKIVIDSSRVRFTGYRIIAPNKKPLTIDGEVDIADFADITTDLRIAATDFQFINVAKNRGSMVYGQGYMDMEATVKGEIDDLMIRGSVDLLRGTEVNYVMQDAPPELKNRAQNMVTFVSFSDTVSQRQDRPVPVLDIAGMDVLMNVNVDNSVRMAVNLSADGENRVDLQGGGNLTYSMNRLGDSRFSGKYVVTGGTVRYNPPVISQKIFKITQGSYVEWIGQIADPTLNITAVETVRTSVTADDGQGSSRPVNFNISINIRNTLENLSVTFDLSAPEDLTIQNQLSSLTAEQRATQAMSLLVYNTYSGPGTTAKVNSANPLNSFIEKELNQWASNSLKGVDLSFGIDTYDDAASGGVNSRTDYSYQLSKSLFNNRVKAVIGGKFSTDADPTENLKENLIDDVALEYQLTKRDNMFLKIFRHTGYESILEGEITETGVGFVIRKKMLKLGDLFRIMRNKVQPQTPPKQSTHE